DRLSRFPTHRRGNAPRARHPAEGLRSPMKSTLPTLAALFLAAGPAAAGTKDYDEQVRPFLARHCVGCHGADKPQGDFRLDRLSPDFAEAGGREKWAAVLKRVKAGEMPPKSKPRPPEKETRLVLDWVEAGLKAADARRAAEGRVVLRRLNRTE